MNVDVLSIPEWREGKMSTKSVGWEKKKSEIVQWDYRFDHREVQFDSWNDKCS